MPWIRFPDVPLPLNTTPANPLPEMRLRASAVVPPIVLSDAALAISIPLRTFLSAAVPSGLVPIRLP